MTLFFCCVISLTDLQCWNFCLPQSPTTNSNETRNPFFASVERGELYSPNTSKTETKQNRTFLSQFVKNLLIFQVKFKCKICGYLYSRKDTLKDHIRGKHNPRYSTSDLNGLVEVVPPSAAAVANSTSNVNGRRS